MLKRITVNNILQTCPKSKLKTTEQNSQARFGGFFWLNLKRYLFIGIETPKNVFDIIW